MPELIEWDLSPLPGAKVEWSMLTVDHDSRPTPIELTLTYITLAEGVALDVIWTGRRPQMPKYEVQAWVDPLQVDTLHNTICSVQCGTVTAVLETVDMIIRGVAERVKTAKMVASQVQGTMALEAAGLNFAEVKAMEVRTLHELLLRDGASVVGQTGVGGVGHGSSQVQEPDGVAPQ